MKQLVPAASFEQLESILASRGTPVAVHFSTSLASACDSVRSRLEDFAEDLPENLRLLEVQVTLDNSTFLERHQLRFLPTLICFAEGQEVERLERLVPDFDLATLLRDVASYYE